MSDTAAFITLEADLDDESMTRRYKQMREDGVIDRPVKNFTRFDTSGKVIFLAAFELFRRMPPGPHDPSGTALLVVDRDGALEANTLYFKNYLKNGRTMASPNDFIYTLPTSVCAELGIYFGIQGQLLYMSSTEPDLYAFAVGQARNLVLEPRHENVLMFVNDNDHIKAAYITRQSGALHES